MIEQLRGRVPTTVSVSVVFVSAMFMSILDVTIVTVALPTIGHDLQADGSQVDWIVVGYLLSLATCIPASGWLGDRFGTKRTFLTALAIFTVASAMCGLSQTLGQLVAFRVLQGVGGGMLTPVGTAMLFRAFPPDQRARAARILVIPTVVAPAVGPVIGGFLVDSLSWRWVFYINLPIAVAFVFGSIFLVEHREARAGRFDLAGFVLAGVGLALILYALGEGPVRGWTSPEVFIPGLIGLAALVLLVRVELGKREPMLRLRLLSNRLFRTSNLVSVFAFGSFLGLLVIMPIYLQELRGVSALQSGLTTFPEAVGVLIASQAVGRLYPHLGPRRLMAGGLTTVSAAMLLLSFMSADTSLWTIRAVMFLAGAGMSFVFIPLQVTTFATITPSDTGQASAIYNAQRQTSAALGVAILSTVLSSRAGGPIEPSNPQASSAFRVVFLVDAAIALIGVLVALTIRDKDAAGTMRARSADEEEVVAVAH